MEESKESNVTENLPKIGTEICLLGLMMGRSLCLLRHLLGHLTSESEIKADC